MADVELDVGSFDPAQRVQPVGFAPAEPTPQLVGVQMVRGSRVAGQEGDRRELGGCHGGGLERQQSRRLGVLSGHGVLARRCQGSGPRSPPTRPCSPIVTLPPQPPFALHPALLLFGHVWSGPRATVSGMHDQGETDEKRMRLRYAGVCRICDRELPARTDAIYERLTKTVRCLTHDTSPDTATSPRSSPAPTDGASDPIAATAAVDPGFPGASARREFERRRATREDRIRGRHPKLGGIILALSEDPQSTTAWDTGALGEERLGKRLNELAGDSLRVLHDRQIPRSRANIDHLAVTPTGIFVIDAKKYTGRPQLKIEGGLIRPRVEKLMVGSRDCTKLVDGMLKQVSIVRDIVGSGVPVHGLLCFVEADWPLIGGAFTTRGVHALWPKKLYPRLMSEGPLSSGALQEIHRKLASALPPA